MFCFALLLYFVWLRQGLSMEPRSRTHFADQVGLELSEICLPLAPKCPSVGINDVYHQALILVTFKKELQAQNPIDYERGILPK